VSRLLHKVGEPIWKSQAGVVHVFGDAFTALRAKQALVSENKTLKENVQRLELSSIEIEVLKQENENLRKLLNRETSQELLAAAILTRPNRTLYDTFIVDVGRRDGVTQGAQVFGAGNIALGTVSDVYAGTSLVHLYSTPGRSTEVLIQQRKEGEGSFSVEAIGRGGGDFEIRIPRGVEVAEGGVIFSSELDGGIFGKIQEIVALPSDSFQTILFSSPVTIQSLRIVTIELQ